jgi:glycosyltransferase involved in cell wall biosynthesis
MRLLLVSAHGADVSYGGAERYVADLATGMRDRGFDPSVLSAFPVRTSPPGIETTTLHATDWRTSRLRRLRNHIGDVVSTPGPRLGEAIEAARPDLVHTSNLPGMSSAVWESARRAGVPVVHTLHDYHLLCPRTTLVRRDGAPCRPHPLLCGLRTKRLQRWAGAVSHVIAGSEYLLRLHRDFFPGARRHVIRLPVAPLADQPHTPPAAPLRTIGYLGGLASTKGVAALLEAAPALVDQGLTIRIAGDGPLRPDVEAAAARGAVVYDGFVDGARKVEFMAACDVGVVPSLWDEPSGPPYVVCEWLAAGRPVLSSPRGGLAEAIEALGGVLPVEPTRAGLLDAVRHLGGEHEWRRALAAVKRPDGLEDVERWLDQHEGVYHAAMGISAAAAGVPS